LERAKHTTHAMHELIETYTQVHRALKATSKETAKTKKLWREGNKSNLIKIGMACIMFPDPSPVGEIIGAGFLVAGAVQKGVQNRALYVGDINKNLQSTIKELNSMQCSVRI
jgi:hypothetical protein